MKQHYVRAVLTLIHTGTDVASVLSGLTRTLQARGHERLYRSVLMAVLRELTAKRDMTTVVVANERDVAAAQTAIAATLSVLGAPADVTPVVRIDETLIGGIMVEHDARRLDRSYKHRLLTIYRSLTT